jgi:probable F420-dependent oxidoreductase
MQYGVVMPHYELPATPIALRDFIIGVEELGYDYLLAYDHVIGANPDREGGWKGPYTYTHTFHEVFTLFSFAAGITETLGFASGILILPQRDASLVAKQAAQVDLLSNGRLRLGVGVGWNKVEMQSLGFDFHNRGKRIDEQVRVMQQLWQHELVTFNGDYHHLDDVGINPLPVQRPIPVWFGGGADVVLRRMARLGAGWIPNGMTPDRAQAVVETLRAYLAENGRDMSAFGIDVRLSMKRLPEDTWDDFIAGWTQLGMTHLAVITMENGYRTPDEHLGALARFKTYLDG